jgi:DNA replication and repair protein RecF
MDLQLLYKPGVGAPDPGGDDTQFSREILGVLDYIITDEIKRGRCLSGPQTDDVEIALDGVNLRTFGSRGETRTAAVSLKLAQAEIVYGTRGVRPVLFFDDIFSELDKARSRKLQERTAIDHQVFIATARAEDVEGWQPADARTWTVREGAVTTR